MMQNTKQLNILFYYIEFLNCFELDRFCNMIYYDFHIGLLLFMTTIGLSRECLDIGTRNTQYRC